MSVCIVNLCFTKIDYAYRHKFYCRLYVISCLILNHDDIDTFFQLNILKLSILRHKLILLKNKKMYNSKT